MSGGIIGSALRFSTWTKATPAATPATAVSTTTSEPLRASISAYVTSASDTAPSAAPRMSKRPCLRPSADSGTWRTAMGAQISAMGTLIRNTQRQPGPSTSQPPRNGPIAAPIPPKPDHRPTALARSSGWKEAWIRAREPGVRSAPPMPCNARAATRTPTLGASPHSREAPANHTTPRTKILRRP